MFGIGFFEALVILGALLVVVGPQRLPAIAIECAKFLRKCRIWMDDIKKRIYEQDTPERPS